MQYMPLHPGLTLQHVKEAITQMLDRMLLTTEQADVLDPGFIYAFFETPIGQQLLHSTRVLRELPFSYGIRAGELEPIADSVVANEMVLIQGVIDCFFESDEGLVLLDFKTDKTSDYSDDDLRERYRLQLTLYARAIEEIWKRPVAQRTLYFFDGCRTISL
jgi:ATP-dependent helicase/nuclease subunit A